MNSRGYRYSIIIITLVALAIRLLNSHYPPLLWDEASIGYNAYSILKTGKDEYGQFLPLVFKSFGDYKPGLSVYLSLPFVYLLGLNPLAVRLPSIIAGALLPLLTYLLLTALHPQSKKLALLAASLIAINPWNIHFSRGAWETNILLAELVLGSWLFIKNRLWLSSLVFAATLYTYQGGKIMTPLLILGLFITTRAYKNLGQSIRFFLPLVIFSLPVIYGILFSSAANRLNVFALWNYHRPAKETDTLLVESSPLNYSLFHSEPLFFARNFLTRYFNHFSPRFLFFSGDWQISRHSAPYIGMLLYPSTLFLLIGLATAITNFSSHLFMIYWLLISPLPGALTKDAIQPVRTLPLSLALIYFVSIGIITLYQKIKKNYRILFLSTTIIAYLLSFIYYIDLYTTHLVKVNPSHWLYGYESAINYVKQHQSNQSVTFTDFYGQPYIFYLFYTQYPPQQYQSQAKLISDSIDTGKVLTLDNLRFQTPDFSALRNKPHQLMIFSRDDVLRQGIDTSLLTAISPINGYSTFYAYQTN